MQRRVLLAMTAAVTMMGSMATMAAGFVEGQDYVVLAKPLPNAEKTIVKVWSYDCPFCYKWDVGVDPKVIGDVVKETGFTFVPMHLETKGKYGRVATEFLAWCQLQDRANGLTSLDAGLYKKAKAAWYVAYHKKGERWTAGEEAFVKSALDATGLTAEAFAAARKDAKVQALADSWKPCYDVAKVQGIPAYVVNGKYLVMTKKVRGIKGFHDILVELSKK